MHWSILRIISSILYATSAQIDDYIVDNFHQKFSITTLVVYSSVIGFIPALIFLFIAQGQIFNFLPLHLFLLILSGILNFFVLYFYLKSLIFGEAAISIIFYRLAPIITMFFSWLFLDETITFIQISGILITIAATILLSFDFSSQKAKFQTSQVIYMLLSTLFTAFALIIFKFITIDYGYVATSFWYFIAFSFCSLPLLFFSKKIKQEVYQSIFQKYPHRKNFIIAEFLNETVYISGEIISNLANTLAPIALSISLGSLQNVFAFIFGFIAHQINPKILKGNYDRRSLIQKISGIILILIGSFLVVN